MQRCVVFLALSLAHVRGLALSLADNDPSQLSFAAASTNTNVDAQTNINDLSVGTENSKKQLSNVAKILSEANAVLERNIKVINAASLKAHDSIDRLERSMRPTSHRLGLQAAHIHRNKEAVVKIGAELKTFLDNLQSHVNFRSRCLSAQQTVKEEFDLVEKLNVEVDKRVRQEIDPKSNFDPLQQYLNSVVHDWPADPSSNTTRITRALALKLSQYRVAIEDIFKTKKGPVMTDLDAAILARDAFQSSLYPSAWTATESLEQIADDNLNRITRVYGLLQNVWTLAEQMREVAELIVHIFSKSPLTSEADAWSRPLPRLDLQRATTELTTNASETKDSLSKASSYFANKLNSIRDLRTALDKIPKQNSDEFEALQQQKSRLTHKDTLANWALLQALVDSISTASSEIQSQIVNFPDDLSYKDGVNVLLNFRDTTLPVMQGVAQKTVGEIYDGLRRYYTAMSKLTKDVKAVIDKDCSKVTDGQQLKSHGNSLMKTASSLNEALTAADGMLKQWGILSLQSSSTRTAVKRLLTDSSDRTVKEVRDLLSVASKAKTQSASLLMRMSELTNEAKAGLVSVEAEVAGLVESKERAEAMTAILEEGYRDAVRFSSGNETEIETVIGETNKIRNECLST